MSHLRVVISRVEDESRPEETTELYRLDLGRVDHGKLKPEKALDQLESNVLDCGQRIMRNLFESQWEEIDEQLVDEYQRCFPPGAVIRDGFDDQRVACRLGILQLHRQVCFNRELNEH